jgi:hypothetical protein
MLVNGHRVLNDGMRKSGSALFNLYGIQLRYLNDRQNGETLEIVGKIEKSIVVQVRYTIVNKTSAPSVYNRLISASSVYFWYSRSGYEPMDTGHIANVRSWKSNTIPIFWERCLIKKGNWLFIKLISKCHCNSFFHCIKETYLYHFYNKCGTWRPPFYHVTESSSNMSPYFVGGLLQSIIEETRLVTTKLYRTVPFDIFRHLKTVWFYSE